MATLVRDQCSAVYRLSADIVMIIECIRICSKTKKKSVCLTTLSFYFQAGLIADFNNGQAACGGSLLNARRVLTAAHCWYDGQNQAWRFTVVLGSIRLFSGGTRVASSSVDMHASWNPSLIRNDIAMINLPSNIGFSSEYYTLFSY